MQVPIAFFIYKRPELTKAVFQQIIASQLKDVFVFADGPTNDLEKEKCEETRAIIDQFQDGKMRLHKHYQEDNIGLYENIKQGLSLVFTQFDQVIILEDDCMPHQSFFTFCLKNLEKFRYDHHIMQISGTSLLNDSHGGFKSLESKYSLPNWGWDTWKRAWEKFNPEFTTFKTNEDFFTKKLINDDSLPIIKALSSLSYGNRNSWDVQWMADLWINGGHTILPSTNLITNLGNGEGSSYMPESSPFCIPTPNQELELVSNIYEKISIEQESRIESSVADLIDGFISASQDVFSLTKQIIKHIEPRGYKEKYSSLEELKEDLIPLPKFTLLPKSFFNLFLEKYSKKDPIFNGNWVQVGCWKGGSSLFLASLREEARAAGKLFIIDTFGDIPTSNLHWEKDIAFVNYFQMNSPISSYKLEVESLLRKYDLLEASRIIDTTIESLLPEQLPEQISFVFIDLDFYEPTLLSLEKLYNSIVKNGVILIDDYYSPFFNCREAVDHFFTVKREKREVSFEQFSSNILMIHKHG